MARLRAADSLRPTAQQAFGTSVAIDGEPRARCSLGGIHDAAILFAKRTAGNAGCAAQLAGACRPASAEAKAPTESAAAEQRKPPTRRSLK